MKTLQHSVKASFLVVLLSIAFASQSFAENRAAFKGKEQASSTRTGSSSSDQEARAREKKRGYKDNTSQQDFMEQNLSEEQKRLILIN